MKTADRVKILEDEVENLRELAGETLATCLVNLKRKTLRSANNKEFRRYMESRMKWLKQIEKRLRQAKR